MRPGEHGFKTVSSVLAQRRGPAIALIALVSGMARKRSDRFRMGCPPVRSLAHPAKPEHFDTTRKNVLITRVLYILQSSHVK